MNKWEVQNSAPLDAGHGSTEAAGRCEGGSKFASPDGTSIRRSVCEDRRCVA